MQKQEFVHFPHFSLYSLFLYSSKYFIPFIPFIPFILFIQFILFIPWGTGKSAAVFSGAFCANSASQNPFILYSGPVFHCFSWFLAVISFIPFIPFIPRNKAESVFGPIARFGGLQIAVYSLFLYSFIPTK